jgi:hypothetical protein
MKDLNNSSPLRELSLENRIKPNQNITSLSLDAIQG